MKSTINERIAFLVEQLSRNQSDFARLSKISTQTLSSILTRGSKPGPDILESILLSFPQVDSLWLICGIGEMQKDLSQTKQVDETDLVKTLKRENEILLRNNESLIKDKERLWNMVENNSLQGKLESNEQTRDSNLVVLDMSEYKEVAYKLTA
ncbi:hypothetical protein LV89_03818 [Arcicella aurantiaca]|uniref:HTH cro/C1-type domain-containing protein n=1 Tax=Arcicella aurantiaca TaxID=591202 RepID=A0A316DR09_9BACT|nr:hypothetical protein [Arcicella aurantiaca]PWK20276.1 hypothetical protein LV89_03818 [Arcicella aurantiaca]